MSASQFTFPPPPPAPPQALQNHFTCSQTHPVNRGYDRGGHRVGRRNKNFDRGNNGRDARGRHSGSSNTGYGGYGIGNYGQSNLQAGNHSAQANQPRVDGYPLPNYPAVQVPQYPPNLRQDFAHQTLEAPSNRGHSLPVNNGQRFFNQPPGFSSHESGLPFTGFQTNVQAFQSNGPISRDLQGNVIHPSPIDQAHQQQSHYMPQPDSNGISSFAHTPTESNGPMHQSYFPSTFPSAHRAPQNSFPSYRGRGQKRGQAEAFGRSRNQNPKPRAAPAVPKFGGALPLPIKPPSPAPQDRDIKPKKKRRKHNQLGLTPKTEEHESSEEEEDDADEESKLAYNISGSSLGSQLLQFQYRGRTSTLNSSSEISAWIEERKKRFPTKARVAAVAEVKQRRDEEQRASNQARREAKEKIRLEIRERQKLNFEEEERLKKSTTNAMDAAAKAKAKIEKLRKQLEKEEKRAAKAEAKVNRTGSLAGVNAQVGLGVRKRERSDSTPSKTTRVEGVEVKSEHSYTNTDRLEPKAEPCAGIKKEDNGAGSINVSFRDPSEAPHPGPDPLTPTSQPRPLDEDTGTKILIVKDEDSVEGADAAASGNFTGLKQEHDEEYLRTIQDINVPEADLSSESLSTASEDSTSSSGSSSDAATSDDDGDAPEESSSKRKGPDVVAPPKRDKPAAICRAFLKSGRCRRGANCRYRHELPERGSRAIVRKENRKIEERPARVGLHQRLVEQEKEKEDHEVLKAIIHLGEKGLLGPLEEENSTAD